MRLTEVSLALLIFSLASCGPEKEPEKPVKPFTKEQLMDANQADARRESDIINAYIRQHGWKMENTGTGLRYAFLGHSEKGDSVHAQKNALVTYKVYLLDGTLCYSSDKDGTKTFRVGEDHVESGIHEVVMYMKTGDSLRCILPSNRAHGLLGDGDKIPPRSPVMYELKLISLR